MPQERKLFFMGAPYHDDAYAAIMIGAQGFSGLRSVRVCQAAVPVSSARSVDACATQTWAWVVLSA